MLPLLRGAGGVSFFDFKIDMFNQMLNNKIDVLKEASNPPNKQHYPDTLHLQHKPI